MSKGPDYARLAQEVRAALDAARGAIDEPVVVAYIDTPAAAGRFKAINNRLRPLGITPIVMSSDEGLLKRHGLDGRVVNVDVSRMSEITANIFRRFASHYRNWYLTGGSDPTVVDGYSIGYIYEQESFGIFRNAVLRLENIRECVRQAWPEVLLTFFPEDPDTSGLTGFLAGNEPDAEAAPADMGIAGSGVKVPPLRMINVPEVASASRSRELRLSYRLGFPGWAYRVASAVLRSLSGWRRFKRQDRPGQQYLFFYAGYSASSLDSIAGVAGAVKGRGVIHLAASDRTVSELGKRGISAVGYGDLYDLSTPGTVLGKRAGSLNVIKGMFSGLAASKNFDYLGISLFPFVKDELARLMKKGLHNTLGRLSGLNRLFAGSDIKALLVASSIHPEPREALMFCRRLGIPVVEVFHGMVSIPPIFGPFLADRIAIWGDGMREWFIENGVDEGKLVMTGQPRYDDIRSHLGKRDDIKAEIGIPTGKRVVMYATTGFVGEIQTVGMVMDALREMEDIVFLIKPHPVEDPAVYEALVSGREGPPSLVARDRNVFDMLAVCDTVLLTFSTVGLEAVLMDRPLVVLSPEGGWGSENYVESGVAVPAVTPAELREAVDGILSGSDRYAYLKDNRARFVYRHNFENDGQACARVAALLDGLSGPAATVTT